MEKLYTIKELAEQLHMTRTWVRRIFGPRPGVLRLGTHLRIPGFVVEKYLQECACGKGDAQHGTASNRANAGRSPASP